MMTMTTETTTGTVSRSQIETMRKERQRHYQVKSADGTTRFIECSCSATFSACVGGYHDFNAHLEAAPLRAAGIATEG